MVQKQVHPCQSKGQQKLHSKGTASQQDPAQSSSHRKGGLQRWFTCCQAQKERMCKVSFAYSSKGRRSWTSNIKKDSFRVGRSCLCACKASTVAPSVSKMQMILQGCSGMPLAWGQLTIQPMRSGIVAGSASSKDGAKAQVRCPTSVDLKSCYSLIMRKFFIHLHRKGVMQ